MNSVKVAIRVRPLISRENGAEVYWTYDTHEIKSDGRRDPYIFDRVFGSDEETRDVYEEIVEPIVEEAMKGFNGTVFAYGQTSSGKTYTMMGSPNGHNPGIIPMAVRDTFSHIQKTPEREFLLRVSYVEIYNEVLKDLLVQPSDAVPLQIRDDEFRNVVVQGLSEHLVSSEADVLELIKKGGKRRQTAGTNMNERSSRSHTIFRMILESRERVDANSTKDSVECEMAVKISQLNLVDLAGSERAHQTGAEGQRFKEGCHINSSLSLLGKVINQICKASENSKGSAHISYRDSKLTRILQPSLGGNALTAIICAVTPVSFVDTDSTLRFASNAKMIKNKPHVNEVLSDEAMLIRQKREINQLKKKIQELELNADKKKNEELESMLIEKEQLQHEQEERIARLKQMLLVSSQPVDTKRQRNVRRETWCPGLKPGLAGASQWGSPKRHLSAINQSSLLNLDHDLKDVEFAPCIKRTRFSDDPVATIFPPAAVGNEDKETSETFPFLEDELIAMRQQQEKTDADLRALRAENTQMKADARLMRGEIETYRESLDEVCEEKQQAETECRELREKAVKLNARISEYVRMEKRWLESNPDCTALRNENADLRKQLSEVCSQRCRLQQKSDEECDEIRSLQSMLDGVSMELKEKEDSVEEFKNQVSALQSQLEATFANSRNQTSSLTNDNKCNQDDVDALKLTVEIKDAELKDAKTELSRLRLDLEDVEQLKSEVARLRQLTEGVAADQYSNRDGAISESVTIGDRTFSDYRTACEALAAESNTLRRELDGLKQENETLQLACESKWGERTMCDAVAEYVELEKDRDLVLERKEALEGIVEEMRTNALALDKRIESLVEQNEFMELEKESFEEQEKENEGQIKLLQLKVADLNSQVETLKSNTVVFAGAGDEKDKDIRNIHEEMLSVQKSSTDAQSMLQDASKELAIANTTIESQNQEMVKGQLAVETEKFMTHSEAWSQEKATLDHKVEESRLRVNELNRQIAAVSEKDSYEAMEKMRISLEEAESREAENRKSIESLQDRLEHATKALEEHKKAASEAEDNLATVTLDVRSKSEELSAKNAFVKELQERIELFTQSVDKMREKIDARDLEIESKDSKLSEFEETIFRSKVELEKCEARLLLLTSEKEALENKISALESGSETEDLERETSYRVLLEQFEEVAQERDALQSRVCELEVSSAVEGEMGCDPECDKLESQQRQDLKDDLSKKEREIERLNLELDAARAQTASQKVSVSEYGMDFSMSIDQEMVDRLYDEISELKLQLEEKNDIIEGLGVARHCQDDDELIGLRREVVDLKLCMEQMARDAGEKDQSSVFGDQRNGSLSSDIKVEDQSNLFEDQKNASLSSDVKIELRSYILEDQRNTSLSSGLKVQDQSKICEDQRNTSLSSDLKVQDQRNTTLSSDLKNQDQSEICEDQRNIPLSSDLKVQDQSKICEDQRNASLSSDIKGDERDFTALVEENGELRKKIAELREILRNNEICREKLLENADSAAVEELEALRKEKAAGEERISELTLMLRGEEDEMAAVKSQLLELGRSLEQENARIVELKRGKKEVEHEILRLQEKNKDLVQKLSTTDEPTVSLDRELEAQLKMSEAEIQRVEEVCRKLEAELDSYKDTHEAAVTARESIESLEKQLEDFNLAKERDISELNARVSDLTSENKELIDRLESLDESGDVKKELETALDTISSLEKKLEDCSLDKEKDITDMKELISALTTKNEELTEGLKRLDELDDKKKELEVSLGTISALEKQLEDCSLAKERDIAEMYARVSDLTSMNEELTDKLKNESDSKKKELETAADTISCLEKQLEDRTFALSDLTTRNEKLTERLKDLEGLDSEKKDLEKEVKRQKEKVRKLKENLESVYAMIREKAAVMEESASSREALERDFNELTNENERLKSRISELEMEQSSKCEKIDGEMRDADMLVEQLRGRVVELEEDRKRIADERDRCRDNAAALEAEIGEVAEKIRCSKVELKNAKHEIESLRVALKKKSQFESRVKDSDALIESLRDELGLLREAKDSLERRVNEMETEEETRREVERREHEEKVKELSDGLARSEAGLAAAVEEREARSRELEEEREERSALTTEVEALKAQLDATSKSRSDEIEALKCRLNDSRKAHADEAEALRGKIKEIEGSRNRGGEFETELKKNLEETKGMLYKKELEVQTLSSEVLIWQSRHEQDKLELNEAIQNAKDEVAAMEERKQALVNDLQEKVALLEQMNENLTEKLESAKEQDEMLGNVAKQQNEKHQSEISELKEDYEKKLSDAKDDTKVRIERLLSKIDEYEQGLFEQDKELEAEQEKVKTLEQKVEELEGRLKTKANPKEPSMKTVKEHCRKLEAKYNQAKQQNQSLDNQLRAEKHRNSQLQSKVDGFVRAAPSSKDIARELVEKRRAKDAYDAELKKIKEEHSEETKVLAERMKRVKKELNEQVTHFEDKLIESEQELDQVKEKNKKLEAELAEMKSRPNVEENKELKKALHGKEREVSRLEIQLEHAKQPLQRENGRLKDELKVSEERIENLKQRVKLAASGKGSAERPQSRVGRVTRSGAAASQSGAPFDSKMCLLEMEVSDYKYRNDLLQCELDKCRDIEKKRMSENMELLELNNHYRSLIKKAREKKAAGGAEVLTENTAILNSASELPKSHTSQDDKCKNQ